MLHCNAPWSHWRIQWGPRPGGHDTSCWAALVRGILWQERGVPRANRTQCRGQSLGHCWSLHNRHSSRLDSMCNRNAGVNRASDAGPTSGRTWHIPQHLRTRGHEGEQEKRHVTYIARRAFPCATHEWLCLDAHAQRRQGENQGEDMDHVCVHTL